MDIFYYYSSLLFLLQFYTLSEGRPNSDIDIGTCKCQSFQTCQWSNESFKRINSGTQFPGETQLFKGISVLKPCIYLFFIPFGCLITNFMGCLPLADLHHFRLTKGFPKNSRLQRHLADRNAICRYLTLIRLCLALFIISIVSKHVF